VTTELASRAVETGAVGVEVAGATDRGTVRTENQDAWGATLRGGGVALALADGMGGHAGGKESAEAAVEAALHRLAEAGPPERSLETAVRDANAAVAGVRDLIGGDPGTTLVLACIEDGHAWIANVGDSRAYLIRGGQAQQLTHDHSWVGDEMRAITRGETSSRAPSWGILSRRICLRLRCSEMTCCSSARMACGSHSPTRCWWSSQRATDRWLALSSASAKLRLTPAVATT
jgi:serine/threonine protein phosphatase PrpC